MPASLGKDSAAESQLFRPYQAVGFVCDHVPFDFHYGGVNESLITTSIGNSYHQYRVGAPTSMRPSCY